MGTRKNFIGAKGARKKVIVSLKQICFIKID